MFSDQHRWLFNLIVDMYSFTSLSHTSSSAALCPNPPALANAMVTFTGNSVNDTATYTCNSGFELCGDPTTTCTAALDWNFASFPAVPPPECKREYFLNIAYMPVQFVSIMPEQEKPPVYVYIHIWDTEYVFVAQLLSHIIRSSTQMKRSFYMSKFRLIPEVAM